MDYRDTKINDKIVSVPEGPVCEDCGDAVDVFKQKTVEEIKEDITKQSLGLKRISTRSGRASERQRQMF